MSWTHAPTLAAPLLRRNPLLHAAALAILGATLVALSAQVSIPLPFTPVPITGQTFAVLLVGSAYGPLLGGSTIILYLAAGLAGAPVYADSASGLDSITGPTGGYLLGFLAAALVVGWLAEDARWDRTFATATASMLAGNTIIYLTGLPLLAANLHTNLDRTLELGLYPFIIGDLLKLYLAALALPLAWRLTRHADR